MNEQNQSVLAETKDSAKKTFFLRRIQERISASPSSYLAYCFIIPVILTYLIYLAMEIHPFGNGSVLVLDLNAQYVYFFEALRDFVHGDADLLYSFSRALGGEFVGMYAYYLASPLSYIVALFPKDMMLEALLTLFLLKAGLCGLTFGFYLHKNSKHTNKVMVVAFSAMYALCAFAVVHQNNTMWTEALILLPLITYGIEQLVKFGKFKLFVISLTLTVWSNYYIGYMVCIYVALYFLFYCIAYGDGRNNPRGEKAHMLKSFVRIAVFSVIAIAISAFIILGAYYSLGFGKNEFSNPNWTPEAKFDLLDFFTKFLPGSYDTVRPEGLPFVYTGLLTLILVPVFFMSKKISSREKLASLAFIAVFCLSFITSTLDLIWHGFQNPNWLNNRYSFMLCFFLLVLAYKGFGNLRRFSEKFILGICAFIILLVAVCEKQEFETYVESESKLLTFQTVWLSVIAAVAFLVLLCLLMRTKNVRKRENIAGILAAVICIELYCSSLACVVQFDGDVVYSNYSGYNDFLSDMREITDVVQENDESFYRMEKTNTRTVNDNMALGMKGLSNSTSTLNTETVEFLNKMGYSSQSHWSKYLGGTPVNDSLLGIKYLIDTKNSKTASLYYTEAYSSEKYTAYLNPYALSLAYGVDSSVNDFDMTKYSSHFERLNSLVSAMLGEEQTLDIFVPIETSADTQVSNCEVSSVSEHYKYTAKVKDGSSVTFTITTERDGEVFFYAPSDYPREAKLSVNGSSKGDYFGNETNRIISLGTYSAGQTLQVKITLSQDDLYLKKNADYFYCLDTEAYEDAFSRLLSNPQYEIDDGCKDSHLTGTITTTTYDQTILTTIPYDEGWKITINGTEAETYKTLGALIAFDIPEAGEYTLEMKYSPTIYTVGFTISVIGIVAFIAICVIEFAFKKLFRRLMKLEECRAEDDFWVLEDFDDDFEEEKLLPPEPKQKKTVKEYLLDAKKLLGGSKNARKSEESKSESEKEENEKENSGNDGADGGN
ncbi:MAG: YfhO family protein [Clostridia bacterium]|nr:YfhO family protein [Clostridia bacterium]